MSGFHIVYISGVVLCERCVVCVVNDVILSGVRLLSECVSRGGVCGGWRFVGVACMEVCVECPFPPMEFSPDGSIVGLAVFAPSC